MKKSVVSALTAALVVGATATTFAAANPFSDVPQGHWAYNSVTKLAADGIIEGYGDGTFLGNRNITRYEMAQMIAKALAKNPSGADRAELDKLAAEFREELNNLGVRVSELEKHADMVQWTGELRYRYWHDRTDRAIGGGHTTKSNNQLQFRLFPTAEVNDHWKVKARLTATDNMRSDESGEVKLTYVYASGNYDKFTLNVGKMPLYSYADDGLVVDDFFSGAQLIFGSKLKGTLEAGRWSNWSDTANYQGVELFYDDDSRFSGGVAYRHFNTASLIGGTYGDSDDANVISVGAAYKFADALKLAASYANNTEADRYEKGYNVELAYKGANRKQAGSWGIFAAYRYVGENVGFVPTYDPYPEGKKGTEFGVTWSPLKNTFTKLSYFHGKMIDTDKTDKTLFARVSWFF